MALSTSQHNRILAVYDERFYKRQHLANKRLKEVYTAIPGQKSEQRRLTEQLQLLMDVKVKKKNSGEIFVRTFQSCNNSKKGKDTKEWAKESNNKFRTKNF